MTVLKQELLLFDRLWFCSLNILEQMMPALGESPWSCEDIDGYLATVHYLVSERIVVDYGKYDMASDGPDISDTTSDVLQGLRQKLNVHGTAIVEGAKGKRPSDIMTDMRPFMGTMDCMTRFNCAMARDMHRLPISPLLFDPYLEDLGQGSEPTDVLRITLRMLPVPSPTTPLDAILDFRNSNSVYLERLYHWSTKVAREALSEKHVTEELESLLFDYEQTMKLNQLEHTTGVLEKLVVGTAEAIENLAKLKFSKLAKQLFSIGTENVRLLKAEHAAPGADVAYVSKIKEAVEQGML